MDSYVNQHKLQKKLYISCNQESVLSDTQKSVTFRTDSYFRAFPNFGPCSELSAFCVSYIAANYLNVRTLNKS